MKSNDVIIVGGGLSGGLLALRCHLLAPSLKVLLIEKGSTLGGNKTWSFQGSDIEESSLRWIRPLISQTWSGQEVHFPSFSRFLPASYHSIQSSRFHSVLSAHLGGKLLLDTEVQELAATSVKLRDGRSLSAHSVWDARGASALDFQPCGFQKFLGQDLLFNEPHGLDTPILMDATVSQEDGFRFFYVLPWDAYRLLIEETHYSDTPDFDPQHYREQISLYAARKGWTGGKMEREEKGCLPIPFRRCQRSSGQAVGTRGAQFHLTTSYSFPSAVEYIETLAPALVEAGASSLPHVPAPRRSAESLYLLLNRMLFRAARPEKRYRVLEHFYRQPDLLIRRFYARNLRISDWVRLLLMGRPPVSVRKAMAVMFSMEARNA